MQLVLLSLSLVQGALLFENNNLNHLDIEFSSSHSVLDRVARDFDDESSGDDIVPAVRSGNSGPSEAPKTVPTSSDITAIQEVVSDTVTVLEDTTGPTPAPVGDDATTTKADNTTTAATPAPEPEPEGGSAMTVYGWTTSLLLAFITVLLL